MSETKRQNYLKGAAILAATNILVKLITALYKIPLFNLLGDEGTGHFQVAFNLYMLLLTISTVGIPVALSRLISEASSTGKTGLVKRYFNVSMPFFAVFGLLLAAIMFGFSDRLATLMGDPLGGLGMRVLAPAVFFSCVIAIFRGYFQGHNQMLPTAISQLTEALSKLLIGLLLVWLLLQWGYDLATQSAGSYMGSVIGLGLSIPVLVVCKHVFDKRRQSNIQAPRQAQKAAGKTVLLDVFRLSIPITLGASILNIMTLIDTKVVLTQLQTGALFTQDKAVALYGIYIKGQSIFNLPGALVNAIAVSIVPVIAATIATKRRRDTAMILSSSLKLTNLLAMPVAVGMCILAGPIFKVIYWNSNAVGPQLLSTFGIASYFMCLQLVTVGILQASGHEKIPLLTCTVGGMLQIALDYWLVGQPDINILGSPFGTLTCYGTISVLNLIFIAVKIPERPNMAKVFLKPALCTAVMGVAAWSVYELLQKTAVLRLGTGHIMMVLYLLVAVLAAAVVYFVLIIATKTVVEDDLRLLPQGAKIAKFLKIK